MLEFERSKLKMKIYGEVYDVCKPTVAQSEAIQEKSESLSEDDIKGRSEVMKDFLAELGLPKEVCNGLELQHFTQIVSELTGSKKN